MSTLSHHRGKERTHDPKQNTPLTLYPQRNREAEVNTRPLGSNFGRAENQDHQQILVLRQSSQDPLQVKSRHHSEVWSPTKWNKLRFNIAKQLCPNSTESEVTHRHHVLPQSQEQNPKRSTSSNTQENYQNTTASSLFCKKANDQVISPHKFFKFNFELSKHPFQKSSKMISNQILTKQFTNDHFGHFSLNFTWGICWSYSTYSATWINPRKYMVPSIVLSFNLNVHDCVWTDTALLDVLHVETEDRSSYWNKPKHTQHNYTSRQVVLKCFHKWNISNM